MYLVLANLHLAKIINLIIFNLINLMNLTNLMNTYLILP